MEIRILDKSGVPAAEVEAHQRIQNALNSSDFSKTWRGYASFKMGRGRPGAGDDDCDLILITHAHVVLIELKNWRGKEMTSRSGRWYVDNKDYGPSPLQTVNLKAKKLADFLKKRLGQAKVPYVSSFVVMSEKLEAFEIEEEVADSVLYIGDVESWSKETLYSQQVGRQGRVNPLNFLQDYDRLFEGQGRPGGYTVQGFRPDAEPMWVHPKNLYSEYRAKEVADPTKLALMRRWNFAALGTELIGQGERGFIGLREQHIYEYVETLDAELAKSLLRPLRRSSEEDVTVDFEELYVLPTQISRLSEFKNSTLGKMTLNERVVLGKAILERFARLHDLRVAHRDAGAHSLWVDRAPRVVVSGFPAATYPSATTVATFRDRVKVDRADLPEDSKAVAEGTPYQRDVFHLGALLHLILYTEAPVLSNGTYTFVSRGEQDHFKCAFDLVLAKALSKIPAQRFETAREMLEAVNAAATRDEEQVVNLAAFDAHRAKTRVRDYPEEHSPITDDDDLLSYQSSVDERRVLVKEWHGIEPDVRKPDVAMRLLGFLERARNLMAAELEGIPKIFDYGLSRRSLLLVREWVEGETLKDWLSKERSPESRLNVARSLVTTLSRLHELEWVHGDVKPDNIIVSDEGKTTLIDLLDFRRSDGSVYTEAYLPKDYRVLGPFERDCYALAAVLEEVLIKDRPQDEIDALKDVHEEILRLMVDRTVMSLAPLQSSLSGRTAEEFAPAPSYVLAVRNLTGTGFKAGELVSDNGEFHLTLEQSKQRQDSLRVHLLGPGSRLTLEWDTRGQRVVWIGVRAVDFAEFARTQTKRVARVRVRVILESGINYDGAQIEGAVGQWIAQHWLAPVAAETPPTQESPTSVDVVEPESTPKSSEPASASTKVDVVALWRALLDAEEEALPIATVTAEGHHNPSRRHQVLVPCVLDQASFDPDADDYAWVERQGGDGNWRRCGELELRDTILGRDSQLAVERWVGKPPKPGERLRLRCNMESESLSRRMAAVERILEGRSVVSNLANYFQPGELQPPPVEYRGPTEEALDSYSLGERSLDESQREAFKSALRFGPISLLQGPPGTGKTWFIACLLHYLVTKEGARRILVVSQAHEAVNNALEKALELFEEKGMPLDAVRLGMATSVSETVKHLHAGSIEQSYRERFKAEYKERVVRLARDIGLPAEFASEMVKLHMTLGSLANHIAECDTALEEGPSPGDDKADGQALQMKRSRLVDTFREVCVTVYDFDPGELSPGAAVAELTHRAVSTHEIASPLAVGRLRDLLMLSDEWLKTLGEPSANFAEFLARSRTIVAGTLVGIGRRADGVVQHLYDWVVIDEAARATPSELAVAMQAGRRILLVGDHKQLPPNYPEEVRDLVAQRLGPSLAKDAFGSDFERLFDSQYGKAVGAALETQYRMAPAIGTLVSRTFYERLKTGRGKAKLSPKNLPKLLEPELLWVDTSQFGKRAWEQSSPDKRDCSNELEAEIIMSIVRRLLKKDELVTELCAGLAPGEPFMGIICMYSKQRDLLNRFKGQAHWMPQELKRLIKVDTVDSYQGKENRIIIVSTVRNNPAGSPGFLRLPNRVNVALSRAMEKLIIVGAAEMWRGKNRGLPLGTALANLEQIQINGSAALVSAKEFA